MKEKTIETPIGQASVSLGHTMLSKKKKIQFHGIVPDPESSIAPDNSAAVNLEKYAQESQRIMEIGIYEVQEQMNGWGQTGKASEIVSSTLESNFSHAGFNFKSM